MIASSSASSASKEEGNNKGKARTTAAAAAAEVTPKTKQKKKKQKQKQKQPLVKGSRTSKQQQQQQQQKTMTTTTKKKKKTFSESYSKKGPPIGIDPSVVVAAATAKMLKLPRERRNPFNKYKWEKLKIKKPKPEPRYIHGKPAKRYRRSIRLRLRARVMIFFGGLAVIMLEKYLGYIIGLDDFKDVYYNQMGIDPWNADVPPWKLVSQPLKIHNLTNSHPEPCSNGLKRRPNIHNPNYHKSKQRIPLIIHQTSKTRCLTNNFERATRDWIRVLGSKWSYYFHDDDAVDKLLHVEFPEFPQLKLIVEKCILTTSTKIYLWQYLILWMYGGLYIDLNLYPVNFNTTTIQQDDDGFFFWTTAKKTTTIEPGTTTTDQQQQLSTKFMAVSPRHPLIYFAIEEGLATILQSRNVGSIDPDEAFGERNLYQAMMDFAKKPSSSNNDGTPNSKLSGGGDNGYGGSVSSSSGINNTVGPTTIHGYDRRSIRVIGAINGPEEYLSPVFIGGGKSKNFAKMGHDQRRKRGSESTESCFQRIWTT